MSVRRQAIQPKRQRLLPWRCEMALFFESEVCGRCSGTGRYSWCQMHGDKCFDCGGSGLRLTKRGRAAQQWYRDSLSIAAGNIMLGQRIKDPHTGISFTVAEIKPYRWGGSVDGVMFTSLAGIQYGYNNGSIVRLQLEPEARDHRKMDALKYQASLTKAGKPRKGI